MLRNSCWNIETPNETIFSAHSVTMTRISYIIINLTNPSCASPSLTVPLKIRWEITSLIPNSKAKLFTDTIESQFRTPFIVSSLEFAVRDTLTRNSATPRTFLIFFSPGHVHEIIKKLLSRRAPGTDGLSISVHKHGLQDNLTHIKSSTRALGLSTSLRAGNTCMSSYCSRGGGQGRARSG